MFSQLVKEQKTQGRPLSFLKDLRILVHVLEMRGCGRYCHNCPMWALMHN